MPHRVFHDLPQSGNIVLVLHGYLHHNLQRIFHDLLRNDFQIRTILQSQIGTLFNLFACQNQCPLLERSHRCHIGQSGISVSPFIFGHNGINLSFRLKLPPDGINRFFRIQRNFPVFHMILQLSFESQRSAM